MTARKANPAKRGRKPKAPGEKLQQFSIRMRPGLFQDVHDLAYLLGSSMSDAIVYCVEQQIARLTDSQRRTMREATKVRDTLRGKDPQP